MIIIRPEGGLCNRIRAIASAVQVSKETGQRLVVIWQKDYPLESCFSDLFEKPKDFSIVDLNVPKNRFVRLIVNRIANFVFARKWMKCQFTPMQEVEFVDYCRRHKSRRLIVFSTWRKFSEKRDYDWLRPVGCLRSKIEALSSYAKGAVGVHIRRTDNIYSIKYSPVELFVDRINTELMMNPNVPIFVASDDDGIKKVLTEKFPKNVYSRDHVAARSERNGIADAVVDLYLLAMTRKIYGSFTSSFSEEAARIGKIPCEIINNGSDK